MRKYVALALAALVASFSAGISYADGYDRHWLQGTQPDVPAGSEAVSIYEYGGFENNSFIDVVANVKSSGVFDSWRCPEGNVPGDEKCDFSNTNHPASAKTLLPFCNSLGQENCIEGLKFIDADGKTMEAEFLRTADNGIPMPAIPDQGLYEGSAVSLFRASGITNGGGTETYAVNFFTTQIFDPYKDKKFKTSSIDVSVYAYKDLRDAGIKTPVAQEVSSPNGKWTTWVNNAPRECSWVEAGVCGVPVALPDGYRIQLDARVSNDIVGWFRGRMSSPEISISDFSKSNMRLSVTAEPVEVARFYAVANKLNTTPEEQAAILAHGGSNNQFRGGGVVYPFSNWGEFSWMEMFRDLANDTAVGTTTIWNFSTIQGASNNKCLSGKPSVLGMVTTNATLYNGVIPEFESGYLKYEVAGLHFLPDGSLNLGTYDLLMTSEVARCLYGFSKAPVSATVAVIGEGGEEKIATTIVSEKNGWLKLAAYGFTFSEKEIQVKLTQPQSKTLTKFTGSTKTLSSKQKAEIRTVVTKAKGNPKFICTGIFVNAEDKVTALKRARAACDYAKSLDKNHSYFAQAKQSAAKSFDAKVMIVSK